MVQLSFAVLFSAAAVLLLLYAVVRQTQRDQQPLSPVRRAWLIGGAVGIAATGALLIWWAWVNPPTG